MTEQNKILALDFGVKRIGLALSDELRLTAQPYGTIECKDEEEDLQKLEAIVKEEKAGEIIIGLPKRLDGSLGDMAKQAKRFARLLRERLNVPVRTWDERFSTHAAERALLDGNVRRKKRKQVIDKTAAVWILQGYLDSKQTP